MRGLSTLVLFGGLVAVGLVLGGGCAGPPPDRTTPEQSADSGTSGGVPGKYAAELAELSADDRALAERQEICPVSGQPLGSMGKPYKVTVQGRDVLLCCAGCEDAIRGDAEAYLGKLPQ
jgi:hypothetical protein